MLNYIFSLFVLAGALIPLVKYPLQGTITPSWLKGIVFGANYEGNFYGAKFEGETENRVFKLHLVQVHLGIMTLTFAWSIEHPDKIWQDYE